MSKSIPGKKLILLTSLQVVLPAGRTSSTVHVDPYITHLDKKMCHSRGYSARCPSLQGECSDWLYIMLGWDSNFYICVAALNSVRQEPIKINLDFAGTLSKKKKTKQLHEVPQSFLKWVWGRRRSCRSRCARLGSSCSPTAPRSTRRTARGTSSWRSGKSRWSSICEKVMRFESFKGVCKFTL